MRRLYFLLPNVDSAKKVVDELLLARVEMMVDAPKNRVDEIGDLVKKHHAEAEVNARSPQSPHFLNHSALRYPCRHPLASSGAALSPAIPDT